MGKYCRNCGNELHTGARFCAKCGAAVPDAPVKPIPVAQPKPAPTAQTFTPSPSAPPAPPPIQGTYTTPPQHAPQPQYAPPKHKNAATPKRNGGRNTLCIVLSVLLVIQIAAVALYGWPGFMVGGKSVNGILNKETPRIGTDTLSLDMGEFPLDGEAECEIKPIDAPPLDGVEMQAYEFSIDTDEELFSVMELTIPYNEKTLGDLDPEGNVGAAYYNKESGEWEPVSFRLNNNGTVSIFTEHLSTYGCFVITDDFTRNACVSYAIPEFAYIGNYSIDANSVITDAVNNGGNPDNSAIQAGLEVLDVALSFGSAGVDTVSYELNSLTGVMGAAPGNSLLNGVSDKLGTLGVAVSAAQIAVGMYDIYNGKTDAIFPCYRDSLKGSVAYVGGKVGSKLFSLAFLGVLAIDYSINKFGETAWAGRTDVYSKAYALYYEEEGGKPTAREWAIQFLKARETARSPERYQLRIEGLVNRYVDKFWADETVVAYYQSRVSKGSGFTGGGGLNETMKAEISAEYANELYRGVLQDAFKMIADRDVRIANKNVLKELNAIKSELNKKCTIDLYDGSIDEGKKQSDVTGAAVVVSLPDSVTDADSWSVTLGNDGSGQIQFTLLAYLMAGIPDKLELYGKGASQSDEPTAIIPFAMDDFIQRVDVNVGAPTFDELIGAYEDGTLTITSVFISDTLRAELENSASSEDSGDSGGDDGNLDAFTDALNEEYAGCDIAGALMGLEEQIGVVNESPFSVTTGGENSGLFILGDSEEGASAAVYDPSKGILTLTPKDQEMGGLGGELRASYNTDKNGVILSGELKLIFLFPESDFHALVQIQGSRPLAQ
ncbi:MAG: zinc ribbon domain-containing protein [Clostridiales bacterium]|jgi:hypothetical protein|nr:zinc ribbon domain-containing protein [Clostridiales bacterium]